jgi:hypothetical protein
MEINQLKAMGSGTAGIGAGKSSVLVALVVITINFSDFGMPSIQNSI